MEGNHKTKMAECCGYEISAIKLKCNKKGTVLEYKKWNIKWTSFGSNNKNNNEKRKKYA